MAVVSNLFQRISERGVGWLFRRSWEKCFDPYSRVGETLVPWMAHHRGGKRRIGDTLVFAYDLSVSPVTFDFIDALVAAEWQRLDLGLSHIEVVIVPGPLDNFRWEEQSFSDAVPLSARRYRLEHIVLAACALLPSVKAVHRPSQRADAAPFIKKSAAIFPSGYGLLTPIVQRRKSLFDRARAGLPAPQVLRAPAAACAAIAIDYKELGAGRRLVVVTIRRYDFMVARNSTIENWTVFARGLDPERYWVVFIPDTQDVLNDTVPDFGDAFVDSKAAEDLTRRAALYEAAWLNISVSCGPMELCWFLPTSSYAILQNVDATPQSSRRAMLVDGFKIGEDFPWATSTQKWFWCVDALDNIVDAFNTMEAIIEAGAMAKSTEKLSPK